MLYQCAACATLFLPGAAACPQCGSAGYREAPGGDVETGAPVLMLGPPAAAVLAEAIGAAAAKRPKTAVPPAPSADTPPAGG
jgi:hypothetical protein